MSELKLPPLNQQTLLIFASGVACSFLLFRLPSLLAPPLPLLRSLLFLAYVVLTHSLAFALWFHRKSLPPPHPPTFTSISPHSPLRYTYFLLLGTLLLLQLLFSEEIADRVWAPILLYLGHVLAHAPFVLQAYGWGVRELGKRMGGAGGGDAGAGGVGGGGGRVGGRAWREGGWVWWALLVPLVLVLTGCGALFTVSEVALSRRDASLAWYVLREVLELLYAMVMVMPLIDEPRGGGEKWLAAYAGRMALWAALAYVSRTVANTHR